MTARRIPGFLLGVASLAMSVTTALAQSSSPPPGATGRVVDPQQAAVARAYVRIVNLDGATVADTLTDQAGRFAFQTPACPDCRIEASLPGFVTVSAEPARNGETMLVLELAPVSEVIVVSAARDETPRSQVAASMTVFTADDIDRRGAPWLGDIIRAAPGVTVSGTGAPGGVTSLFVRGGESSYNKVLLDGMPLNEPGGTFNLSNLTTMSLERVELVRGAQSALFGSDAMSSVLQLFTRRGQPGAGRPKVGVSWEGGSFGTMRASADVSGASGRLDYRVGISQFDTANDLPNNDFRNTTVFWNAGVTLADGWLVRTVGRVEDQLSGSPGATAFGRPDLDAAFDRQDVAAGLTAERRTATLTHRATYSYTRSRQQSTNLVEDPPFVPTFEDRAAPFAFFDFLFDSDNVLGLHHAGYQVDWRPGRAAGGPAGQFVTVALDYDGERATLTDRLNGSSLDAARDNVGLTGQYQLVSRALALTGGLRAEWNDSFGTAVVPRLSIGWTLRDAGDRLGRTVLKGNVGLGVKEPTILQSFSQSPFFLGNPDLEPERATTVDLGVEQRLAGDRAKIDVVWFDNRYRNQIATRTIDFTTFASQFFNIGRTRARGIELETTVVPAPAWRLRGGYTFLASRIVESTSEFSPVFAEGQWAFRRPRHSGFLEVGWQRGPVHADLFGLFVGRRVDSDFSALEPPMVEADGYATWTVTAGYRVRRPLELFLRAENLTGSRHMEPLGFPALGRSAHAGIRLVF